MGHPTFKCDPHVCTKVTWTRNLMVCPPLPGQDNTVNRFSRRTLGYNDQSVPRKVGDLKPLIHLFILFHFIALTFSFFLFVCLVGWRNIVSNDWLPGKVWLIHLTLSIPGFYTESAIFLGVLWAYRRAEKNLHIGPLYVILPYNYSFLYYARWYLD